MAGLAQLLHARGIDVCGSDTNEEFFTDALLAKSGISVESFSPSHITPSLDCVITSTAYPESHPELCAAREAGIPILTYPQALSLLFNAAFGIAVCGSHGKTTTSAMITYLFVHLGLDPTAVVGSQIHQLGSNAIIGNSPYFVLEADEYQNKLSLYDPKMIVMTTVDYDHPDFFPDEETYRQTFAEFAGKIIDRKLIACWDDPGVKKALISFDAKNLITYGWDPSFDYSASNYRIENGRRAFTIAKRGIPVGDYSLSLIGKYNASNALAALAVCDTLKLAPLSRAAEILGEFTGTARRFEYKGTRGSLEIIDDYGHHPTEIRATLHAARHQYPDKKIWCVFGSHTYSRTQTFLDQFGDSFHHVDRVLVLDIYTSAREREASVTAEDLVTAINRASGNAQLTHTHADALKELLEHENEIDILITMGAGDVYKIADHLVTEPAHQ
mgnify:CR=1 FL=1